MQVRDTKANSPTSDVVPKLAKVLAPPIPKNLEKEQRPENQRRHSCFVRAPSLDSAEKNIGAIAQGDIDAHNGHNESCELFISEATRPILEQMDASQVESARKGTARMKLIRKQSGIDTEDLGKYSREFVRELSGRSLVKRASERCLETLAKQFESFVSFDQKSSDDLSDDDSDESDDKEAGNDQERRSKSMSEVDRPTFKQPVEDYAAGEEEDADETKKVKDVVFSLDEPATTRVTPSRKSSKPTVGGHARFRRRTVEDGTTLMPKRSQGAWKPLSSNQHDVKYDEEESKAEHDNEKSEDGMGEKIGNLWNKLTSSFTSQETPPKKQRSASSYFRRGKKKADKCQFLQAVALYNFTLIRQREELGENHIDCGTTLNEIGVCWMMLGERYPALTALQEALYIRKKKLGDGAKEVAETTTNILMVFQEEREDM